MTNCLAQSLIIAVALSAGVSVFADSEQVSGAEDVVDSDQGADDGVSRALRAPALDILPALDPALGSRPAGTNAAAISTQSAVSSPSAVSVPASIPQTTATSSLPKHEGSFDGHAHWYGGKFHGRKTASGQVFDKHKLTAAHPSLPFGTKVRVKSLHTGKDVVVVVTDRCPPMKQRCIDLSEGAAQQLGIWPAAPNAVHCELVSGRETAALKRHNATVARAVAAVSNPE